NPVPAAFRTRPADGLPGPVRGRHGLRAGPVAGVVGRRPDRQPDAPPDQAGEGAGPDALKARTRRGPRNAAARAALATTCRSARLTRGGLRRRGRDYARAGGLEDPFPEDGRSGPADS